MVDQETTVQAQFPQAQEVWASVWEAPHTAIGHLKASCTFLKKSFKQKE